MCVGLKNESLEYGLGFGAAYLDCVVVRVGSCRGPEFCIYECGAELGPAFVIDECRQVLSVDVIQTGSTPE